MTHLTDLLRIAIPKTKLNSTHEGGSASSRDPNTNRETGFERDYKCDNCVYPDDGHARVVGVNEQL